MNYIKVNRSPAEQEMYELKNRLEADVERGFAEALEKFNREREAERTRQAQAQAASRTEGRLYTNE